MTTRRAADWFVDLGVARRPVRVVDADRARLALVARACGAPRPARAAADGPGELCIRGGWPAQVGGGRSVARAAADEGELILRVEQALDDELAADPGPRLLLHASVAVDRRGRAALFVGASGAGKSSLAVALAFRGWRWGGDECVAVRADEAAVEVCRRPVGLRPDVLSWLVPSGQAPPALLRAGAKAFLADATLPRSRARRPVPLSALVVLARPEADDGPIDAGAAFAALLASCHAFQARGAWAFGELARLAREVPTLQLAVRDGAGVVERCRRLLEPVPGR